MFAIEARYVGRKFPAVYRTPVTLSDLSTSISPGRKLRYSGYEFDVPWAVDDKKTKQISPTSEVIAFESGNALWFSRAPARDLVNKLLQRTDMDPRSAKMLYGGEALGSDYSLLKAILDATPRKVGLLSSRRQAVGTMMLLLFKGMIVSEDAETGVFELRSGEFRGFQYGDPLRRPRSINVEIFAGDVGLAFLFAQRVSGPVPPITQAEINRVIQSTHKVPEADSSASR